MDKILRQSEAFDSETLDFFIFLEFWFIRIFVFEYIELERRIEVCRDYIKFRGIVFRVYYDVLILFFGREKIRIH